MRCYTTLAAAVISLLAVLYMTEACNEVVCASLVSKCMLIKCCECDMTDKANCTCCSDCQKCLSKLYMECCSCVGMCPAPDPDDSILKSSTIETLPDPIPALFNVLTQEEDDEQRWTTHTYPVHFDTLYFREVDTFSGEHGTDRVSPVGQAGPFNCTVAFMSKCVSAKLCKQSCRSMGAAKYRWFHEHGCCQCIGHTCIDYGLNEAKCIQCPDEEEEDDYEDEYILHHGKSKFETEDLHYGKHKHEDWHHGKHKFETEHRHHGKHKFETEEMLAKEDEDLVEKVSKN